MPEKLTYEYVKNYIESVDGYKLLSIEYENSHSYLQIKCKKNHIFKQQFYNFKNGHRCPKCANEYKAKKRLTKIGEIKEFVEKEGYKLISTEYNRDKKIIVKCPNEIHPEYEIRWSYFKRGERCKKCWFEKIGDRDRLTYEYVKNYVESVPGYKLLSDRYKRNNIKLNIQCSENHVFKMRFNNFKDGQQRCPECSQSKMFSKGEKEVLEYIKTIYTGKIIENDRTIILNNLTGRNLELDIWLPELNLAIEYNGLYWHSSKDSVKNDSIKLEECKKKGILLYIIMDKEWQENQEYIKNKIKHLLSIDNSL